MPNASSYAFKTPRCLGPRDQGLVAPRIGHERLVAETDPPGGDRHVRRSGRPDSLPRHDAARRGNMASLVSPILVPGDSPTGHETAGGDREATPRWRVWLCARRMVSSLPACPRGEARRVPVFGRVGPPSCHVCHSAGRPSRVDLGAICGAQTGGVRPAPPSGPRPRAGAGGPCVLTRCRVVRGGGVMRCAGRRRRPCGAADGLAPPAPAAPDTRRAGPRRRAIPAR